MLEQPQTGVQRALTKELAEVAYKDVLRQLPVDKQAWLRSCGGPGAGGWLQVPSCPAEVWADRPYGAALRLRLGLIPGPSPYASFLGDTEGGAAVARHNALRDFLAQWLKEHTLFPAPTEQLIPELVTDDGTEARLDVVAHDDFGARILVDVAVTHAASANAPRLARAALVNGAAARTREGTKHARYQNATDLVPFVLETGGRVGAAARAMVQRLAPVVPEMRSAAVGALWRGASARVQKANAMMALAACAG